MSAPKPLTSGRLEKDSLPSVLRSLLRLGSDGCLTVSRGSITRRLYLRGGMIVYGTSNEPTDRLGEILIAQGKLSKADHKKYWAQSQADNRQLGITLLVNGRITLHDLYQGVMAQMVTILDRLQKWREGEFSFEEGVAPAPGTVLLQIPLALYLKADTEKKPPRTSSAKRKKAPRAAAPPRAVQPVEEELIIVAEATADPTAAPTAAAAQELARIGEVSFMVQELRKRVGQGPHALLGLSGDAKPPAVQAAFHRIAKVLHPDRLPPGCPPELAEEAGEIFREVAAASHEAAEEGPSQNASQPEAAPAPRVHTARAAEEQGRRFFAQGREWIAKGNYWQAADALRQAVRLCPEEALFRQYLGLALMQTKRLHEAEEHLVAATRLEPGNASHFVNLGRIYRAGRLFKKAREAFERSLRLEPRNEHAREELADLPEEQPPVRKAESGGLLKKLFGK